MIEDYYGYIYKTTNLLSNRIYIGQCKGKFRAHYLGSGVIIKKAVKDKGKNNFKVEVLEYCYSLDILNEREIYWIKFYNSTNLSIGYNIDEGGKGRKIAESTKLKLSIAHKGKKLTEEHKNNIAKSQLNKKHSPKTKLKMSLNNLGRIFSDEHKKNIGIKTSQREGGNKGRIFSEQWKKNIGKASKGRNIGRKHSEETLKLMSEKRKLYWENKKKRNEK
jgi:group I intron endonuclease